MRIRFGVKPKQPNRRKERTNITIDAHVKRAAVDILSRRGWSLSAFVSESLRTLANSKKEAP